jgi:formylglycine-generating enzyme
MALAACEDEPPAEPVPTTPPPVEVQPAVATAEPEPAAEVMPEPRCPPDMVKVTPEGGAAYCVDRYEAMLIDATTAARISPYYSPTRKWATHAAKHWESKRFEIGPPSAQSIPLPPLPAWQLQRDPEPRAVARGAVTPNGHVSGKEAEAACRSANKRLCSWQEWRTACGGEKGWQFPYGESYEQGACNVFREAHPAAVLHDNPSIGHTDPRLNQVTVRGRPLLRKTGETVTCTSRWGDDVIYDMVGNVDEWIDNPDGEFAGGFYARATKEGCEWHTKAHPAHYADYSTGVRCCADLPRSPR